MKTKKYKKQGISLIVLIITIIVMIVLAAAIILALNNSGIINKANEAVEVTDLAQVKHIATLKWSEAYLDKKISQEELYDAVIDGLRAEKIDPDNYDITVTEAGVDVALKVKVPNNWKENVVAIVDTVPIPKGFVASKATGESTKAGGLVIYEGTDAVTDANVENARRTRNQYVWVPVENFSEFVRGNYNNETHSNILGRGAWEVVLNLETNIPLHTLDEQNAMYMSSTTLAEVKAMYASVKEYKGFYIARYEAGINTQRTSDDGVLETDVYSMMGKIPYTYVPWTKNNVMNEDTDGAVQVARSMYPVTNIEYGVVSTLTYCVQWDTVLQYWLDTNAVVSVTDSTDYGNHRNHTINSSEDLNSGALVWEYTASNNGSYVSKDSTTLTYPKASGTKWALSTGALKAATVNNIYDMAGNMLEWTMEGMVTDKRVFRGGHFCDGGATTDRPIVYRDYNTPGFVEDIARFPYIFIHKDVVIGE